MLSSEITYSISSSRNAFHKILATKLIRQQQIHLKVKHLSVRNNIWYYPYSEISSLVTLNTTLPYLLHSQTEWIQYWYEQGGHKNGLFTAAVWPTSPRQTNLNYTGIFIIPS